MQYDYRDSAIATFLRSGEDIIEGIRAANALLERELGYSGFWNTISSASIGEQLYSMLGGWGEMIRQDPISGRIASFLGVHSRLDPFDIDINRIHRGDIEHLERVAENMEAL